ncbi:MAG: dTDP-4-dehydrorhamnose 3,5-epimerase [Bacteroidetes bacterium]|nr:MAG: dTDP-4-dehydrorhamnose 3,5-epimerase [Bacteroidota bacterium]
MDIIKGVTLTPLKIIPHPKGDILHGIKKSDATFAGFGEAYFSTIRVEETKGWKKHSQMTLNLVVPVGKIRFVVFSESENRFFDVILGEGNYQRLTVEPNLWVAFRGIGKDFNLLLNLANLEHNLQEAENKELNSILFDW